MATTTVVTPQEVDSVIAYQERIERERSDVERNFERLRKEREESASRRRIGTWSCAMAGTCLRKTTDYGVAPMSRRKHLSPMVACS